MWSFKIKEINKNKELVPSVELKVEVTGPVLNSQAHSCAAGLENSLSKMAQKTWVLITKEQ